SERKNFFWVLFRGERFGRKDVSEVLHEDTYGQPCIQHFGVLDSRKTVYLSKAERAAATNHTPANLLAAFVSAPGTDVSCAWRDLSRSSTRVRLPSSIWRFTGRSVCLVGSLGCGRELEERAVFSMGVRVGRNN